MQQFGRLVYAGARFVAEQTMRDGAQLGVDHLEDAVLHVTVAVHAVEQRRELGPVFCHGADLTSVY